MTHRRRRGVKLSAKSSSHLGLLVTCGWLAACGQEKVSPPPVIVDPVGGQGPGTVAARTGGAGRNGSNSNGAGAASEGQGGAAVGPGGGTGSGATTGGTGGTGGVAVPVGCHCTRQPQGPASPQCPPGAGASVSVIVDAAGGTVTLLGQQGASSGVPFSLDVPPTALPAPTSLTVTETAIPPPAGYVDYSPVYQVEPLGVEFAVPVELTVPWGNVSGQVSPLLAIYVAPDGSSPFQRLPDSTGNAGFNRGSITRGGLFFVGYPGVICGSDPGPIVSGPSAPACFCSRRPEGQRSWQCPLGVGESSAATLGGDGGTVALTGQQGKASGVPFSLTVPTAALVAPVAFTLTETTIPPPAGYVDYSPVYRVAPGDVIFAVPATLTVPWGNVGGAVSSSLTLYAATDEASPFRRVDGVVGNAGFLQATITQGGLFFAGYPASDAGPACSGP